ncbi:MAG: hypothetical protein ACYDDC_04430 [Thermoplasmataceae archaeon]
MLRFPKYFPELNLAEKYWNEAKCDLLGSIVPENFCKIKMTLNYFRKKKINLNMVNHLFLQPYMQEKLQIIEK